MFSGVAMKAFKILLALVLAAVAGLYCFDRVSTAASGRDEAPSISCPQEALEVSVAADDAALLAGVTAFDAQDGDLTYKVRILGISKFIEDYTAKITYVVFDSHNNMSTCSRPLRFTDYRSPVFAVKAPLIYPKGASMLLLDRLSVTDVIDGDITDSIRVTPIKATSDPEIYTVDIQVTNSMGDTVRITLPVIQQESSLNRAEVTLSSSLVYLKAGSSFNAGNYLRSVSTPKGWASPADVEITGNVDTNTPGTYMVYYEYRSENYSGTSVLTVVVE